MDYLSWCKISGPNTFPVAACSALTLGIVAQNILLPITRRFRRKSEAACFCSDNCQCDAEHPVTIELQYDSLEELGSSVFLQSVQ